ncbi:MAG: Rab family GTPase, partial [Deinococcales bacterium]
MTPFQFKICLLGGSAVGKTSLIARFVHSIYSSQYHTTVGVRIEKKLINTNLGQANLMIWDINGEDAYQRVQTTYLRGMAGYFLVADGTREQTVDECLKLHARAIEGFGALPAYLLLNKSDLESKWKINPATLGGYGLEMMKTSALSGANVESAFVGLATKMLE